MTLQEFQADIRAGIPDTLPAPKPYDKTINHAPKRKDILTNEEKVLALKNALRYFPTKHHETLAKEFMEELKRYGRIYMYRYRPDYEMNARPIEEYPARSRQASRTNSGRGSSMRQKPAATGPVSASRTSHGPSASTALPASRATKCHSRGGKFFSASLPVVLAMAGS